MPKIITNPTYPPLNLKQITIGLARENGLKQTLPADILRLIMKHYLDNDTLQQRDKAISFKIGFFQFLRKNTILKNQTIKCLQSFAANNDKPPVDYTPASITIDTLVDLLHPHSEGQINVQSKINENITMDESFEFFYMKSQTENYDLDLCEEETKKILYTVIIIDKKTKTINKLKFKCREEIESNLERENNSTYTKNSSLLFNRKKVSPRDKINEVVIKRVQQYLKMQYEEIKYETLDILDYEQINKFQYR